MPLLDGIDAIRRDPSIYPLGCAGVGRLLGFGDRSAIFRFLKNAKLKKPGWAIYEMTDVEKIWRAWCAYQEKSHPKTIPPGGQPSGRAHPWFSNILPAEMDEIRLCAHRMRMGIGEFFLYAARKVMDEEGRSGRIPEMMP